MAKRLKEYLAEIRILGSPSKVAFVTSVKGSDGMTVEVQRATLQNFHTGAVQIIVATSVLDEGIDVSACNLIIKYNTSSSAVAKIQRAGYSLRNSIGNVYFRSCSSSRRKVHFYLSS